MRRLPLTLLLLSCATPTPPPPPPPTDHATALALLSRARAAREAGDLPSARESLLRAAVADPEWDLPRLDLAEMLLREEGDAAGALRLLDTPGLREGNPRLARLRGSALEQAGDDAGAARAYGETLAIRDDPELRLRRALLLVRSGNREDALAELERLRAEKPLDLLARQNLADLYEATGRTAEAEAELRFLAARAPADPAPLRRLAAFLRRMGDDLLAAQAEQAARALEAAPRPLRPLRPDRR